MVRQSPDAALFLTGEASSANKGEGAIRYAAHILVGLYLLTLALAASNARGARAAPSSVERVICGVFGPYCSQALRVAWCESRLRPTAQNGQYLGLFQMGDTARRKYGHGSDPWTQAEAAFRYFADSGFSWGPWSCQP